MSYSFSVHSRRAFTLTEILVVLAIMGVLAAIAVPSFMSLQKTTQLNSGVQVIMDNLNLARQTAITQNRNVEFRFYHFKDNQLNPPGFRAVCYYILDEEKNEVVPQTKLLYLPNEVLLVNDINHPGNSSLLDPQKQSMGGNTKIAGFGDVEYASFRFRPNGSTDLNPQTPDNDTWFVTIQLRHEGVNPKNFYVVQIDPATGKVRALQ